jgi:hypothetical protein
MSVLRGRRPRRRAQDCLCRTLRSRRRGARGIGTRMRSPGRAGRGWLAQAAGMRNPRRCRTAGPSCRTPLAAAARARSSSTSTVPRRAPRWARRSRGGRVVVVEGRADLAEVDMVVALSSVRRSRALHGPAPFRYGAVRRPRATPRAAAFGANRPRRVRATVEAVERVLGGVARARRGRGSPGAIATRGAVWSRPRAPRARSSCRRRSLRCRMPGGESRRGGRRRAGGTAAYEAVVRRGDDRRRRRARDIAPRGGRGAAGRRGRGVARSGSRRR